MAHIDLPEGIPGIVGPMMKYPETEKPLNQLAQALLRGDSPLSEAERELIASFVSSENDCYFCSNAHGATAAHLLDQNKDLVGQVQQNFREADISDKMKALLAIAQKVQQGGLQVTEELVQEAKNAGADDKAIHDTVLIAAAFCMFNRYVDGLATWAPKDENIYANIGKDLATDGYVDSISRQTPDS